MTTLAPSCASTALAAHLGGASGQQSVQAYAAFMAMEAAKWAPVVRAAGLGVD